MRVLHPSAIAASPARESQPTLLVMNMQIMASVTVTTLITINRLLCQLCPGTYSCPASTTRARAWFYCVVDRPRLISFRSHWRTVALFFFSSSIFTAWRNNYGRNDRNNVAIKVAWFTLALFLKQLKKDVCVCTLNNRYCAFVSIKFKCKVHSHTVIISW